MMSGRAFSCSGFEPVHMSNPSWGQHSGHDGVLVLLHTCLFQKQLWSHRAMGFRTLTVSKARVVSRYYDKNYLPCRMQSGWAPSMGRTAPVEDTCTWKFTASTGRQRSTNSIKTLQKIKSRDLLWFYFLAQASLVFPAIQDRSQGDFTDTILYYGKFKVFTCWIKIYVFWGCSSCMDSDSPTIPPDTFSLR